MEWKMVRKKNVAFVENDNNKQKKIPYSTDNRRINMRVYHYVLLGWLGYHNRNEKYCGIKIRISIYLWWWLCVEKINK